MASEGVEERPNVLGYPAALARVGASHSRVRAAMEEIVGAIHDGIAVARLMCAPAERMTAGAPVVVGADVPAVR